MKTKNQLQILYFCFLVALPLPLLASSLPLEEITETQASPSITTVPYWSQTYEIEACRNQVPYSFTIPRNEWFIRLQVGEHVAVYTAQTMPFEFYDRSLPECEQTKPLYTLDLNMTQKTFERSLQALFSSEEYGALLD